MTSLLLYLFASMYFKFNLSMDDLVKISTIVAPIVASIAVVVASLQFRNESKNRSKAEVEKRLAIERSQAIQISAWQSRDEYWGNLSFTVNNFSNAQITSLVICVNRINKTKEIQREEIYAMEPIIPPGAWEIITMTSTRIPVSGAIKYYFTDSNSISWLRDTDGRLTKSINPYQSLGIALEKALPELNLIKPSSISSPPRATLERVREIIHFRENLYSDEEAEWECSDLSDRSPAQIRKMRIASYDSYKNSRNDSISAFSKEYPIVWKSISKFKLLRDRISTAHNRLFGEEMTFDEYFKNDKKSDYVEPTYFPLTWDLDFDPYDLPRNKPDFERKIKPIWQEEDDLPF